MLFLNTIGQSSKERKSGLRLTKGVSWNKENSRAYEEIKEQLEVFHYINNNIWIWFFFCNGVPHLAFSSLTVSSCHQIHFLQYLPTLNRSCKLLPKIRRPYLLNYRNQIYFATRLRFKVYDHYDKNKIVILSASAIRLWLWLEWVCLRRLILAITKSPNSNMSKFMALFN